MRNARQAEAEPPADLAAWQEAYRAGLPEPAAGCPSDDELAALATGDLTGEARLALADHVTACRRCAETYRTLAELHRAASEASTAAEPRTRRGRRWLLAGAAAAVLAAALGLAVLGPPSEEAATLRGAASTERTTDPPHGARLAEPPQRLGWAREEPDATYRAVVYDAESIPLWESEPTAEVSVELPPELRDRLAPGIYYWRIRTATGLEEEATPLRRFEIVP